ncbi:hypothetical protein MKLM6_4371 (plasmid) [Methylomonas koyamae]|nr:hypothetical protein MKLM6_4371 [Methylomonas koyamae]
MAIQFLNVFRYSTVMKVLRDWSILLLKVSNQNNKTGLHSFGFVLT